MSTKAQVNAAMTLNTTGVARGARSAEAQIESMGQRMRASIGRSMRGIATGVGVAMAASVSALSAKGLSSGLNQMLSMETAELAMKSMLGSAAKARDAMAMVNAEAAANPMFSKEQLATAAKGLSVFADSSISKLKGLLDTAKKISILKPEQGIEGAAFALKEALGGNYLSLISRFDLDKGGVNKFKDQGLSGKELVDAVLKAQGITDQTLRDLSGSRSAQLATFNNQLTNIGEDFWLAVWPDLGPALTGMSEWMKENGKEVVSSLKVIAQATGMMADAMIGTASVWDSMTQWAADKTVGTAPVHGAMRGIAATGTAIRDFSSGDMTAKQALDYIRSEEQGAQLGARALFVQAQQALKPKNTTITINTNQRHGMSVSQ